MRSPEHESGGDSELPYSAANQTDSTPYSALALALSVEPDSIYLLSLQQGMCSPAAIQMNNDHAPENCQVSEASIRFNALILKTGLEAMNPLPSLLEQDTRLKIQEAFGKKAAE